MVTELHARMDAAVARYVPVLEQLGRYHWSIMQAEYATDIVFRSAATLAPLYDHLLRTAILVVKVTDVATFLGRSSKRPTDREAGSDFSIRHHGLRIEGRRVRHYLGPASIKMYDKHGFILRVETTTNDVTLFRHHRMVEQLDGQRVMNSLRSRSPSTPSVPDLASISRAANNRYIDFLSTIDYPTPGIKTLSKISDSVEERDHRYRGFNFFDDDDQKLFETHCRGEFFIHGFRNRSLREHLKCFRSSQISRLLKRLRLHGIIKKVGKTYKYYLTELGRHVAVAGLTLKNLFLVPEFASAALAHSSEKFLLFCNQSSDERTTLSRELSRRARLILSPSPIDTKRCRDLSPLRTPAAGAAAVVRLPRCRSTTARRILAACGGDCRGRRCIGLTFHAKL